MNNSPLEFLAKKYGNVVKYDQEGNVAGIFVRFNKCKSSDLVSGLPSHTHPAFIVNGVEQDYILLGKYKAGENGEADGKLLSLPNIRPGNSMTADENLSRIRAAAPGVSGMTIADYGFIKLLAQKEGWSPKGNSAYGQNRDDATVWKQNTDVAVGDVRAYEGVLYTCLVAHNTGSRLKPDIAKGYWKAGKRVGAISSDTTVITRYQTGYRTLNGTGPKSWYLGSDPANLYGLVSESLEFQWGYRTVDAELQILENNDAADPAADLSESSAAWKAILPNAGDDGYTLVAPGTPGTLHWNHIYKSGEELKVGLDTQCDVTQDLDISRLFTELVANTARLPYVPHIVKELGLFPTGADDQTSGTPVIHFRGERLGVRGCTYDEREYYYRPGLGFIYGALRSYKGVDCAGRPRALAGA